MTSNAEPQRAIRDCWVGVSGGQKLARRAVVGAIFTSVVTVVVPVSVGCSTASPESEKSVPTLKQPLMPYVCGTNFTEASAGECSASDVCGGNDCQYFLWECNRYGHSGRLYAVSVNGVCSCATECDVSTPVHSSCGDDWDCGIAESCVNGECSGWGS